jgi:hypothetical protein
VNVVNVSVSLEYLETSRLDPSTGRTIDVGKGLKRNHRSRLGPRLLIGIPEQRHAEMEVPNLPSAFRLTCRPKEPQTILPESRRAEPRLSWAVLWDVLVAARPHGAQSCRRQNCGRYKLKGPAATLG